MSSVPNNQILTFSPYERAHEKAYNKTCATSEDSDQPAHPRSLIRVFADRMCLLQRPGYPKKDRRESLPYWVDVQIDRSRCRLHRSNCRIRCALAQIIKGNSIASIALDKRDVQLVTG